MDCNMPVMNGYEAVKNLKDLMKKDKIPNTKIVFCTADAT